MQALSPSWACSRQDQSFRVVQPSKRPQPSTGTGGRHRLRHLTSVRPLAPESYDGARRSLRHGGGRESRTAVALNKVRDYRVLEREYITSQMSLRELCRRHGITSHSLVVVQAKQGNWAEKREAYRTRESDTFIRHHAVRMAAREAEVRIHALDAIDEAITKFRVDMQRAEEAHRR